MFSVPAASPIAILSAVLVIIVTLNLKTIWRIWAVKRRDKRTTVSTDADLNRFVLQNEMKLFEQGWPPHFGDMFGKSSILLSFGDAHKFHRSIFLGFLTSTRLQTTFLREAEKIAADIMGSWVGREVVSAAEECKMFTFNFIAKQAMSLAPGEPENERLKTDYDSFYSGLISLPVDLPGTRFRKALTSRADIKRIIERKMKEKMEKKGEQSDKVEEDDFLGWLMNNTKYSDEEIIAQIITFLFAGHDTTSTALPTAIYFLEHCPQALQQMREEHLQVVRSKEQGGESKLTLDDYKNMDFTHCVILEVLRLSNVASPLRKRAIKDVRFKDYVIPRGNYVLVVTASVHSNPSFFEEPERFNPWRWMTPSGVKRSNNLMPFGGGPRHCVGSELAKMEMAVFLRHLVLSFKWESVEPDHPVAMPQLGFKKGLPIKVQKLSPSD